MDKWQEMDKWEKMDKYGWILTKYKTTKIKKNRIRMKKLEKNRKFR